MKSRNYRIKFLLVILSLSITGCRQAAEKEASTTDETQSQEMQANERPILQTLDPALDPMEVGKEFTKVLSDTLNVKLYEITLKPGDSVGLHQHLDHTVYVLEGGTLLVYIDGVEPVEMEMQPGIGFVGGPLTDSAKNIGETNVKLLMAEIHRPRVN